MILCKLEWLLSIASVSDCVCACASMSVSMSVSVSLCQLED